MDSIRVDFAFLADYGEVSNKIYAQGIGIDALLARQVPVRHPQLFLVAQFRAAREVGEVEVELSFSDPQGKPLMKSAGKMRFTPSAFGDESMARFAMGFYNLDFQAFGVHNFTLSLQSHERVRLPLRLVQVGQPAEQPPVAAAPN